MIRCCGIKSLQIEPHYEDTSKFRVDATRSRGFDRMCNPCRYKYNLARQTGSLPVGVRKTSLTHRFLDALQNSPEKALEVLKEEAVISGEGCWLWPKSKIGGYGNFIIRRPEIPKFQVIHHFSYWLSTGKLPVETIHHKCSNRSCFNPDHLQEATSRENVGEMFARKSYEKRIRLLEERVSELEENKN